MLQPSQLGSMPEIKPTLPEFLIFSKWLGNDLPKDNKSLEDALLKGGKKKKKKKRLCQDYS